MYPQELESLIRNITPVSLEQKYKAYEHMDSLTKPRRSLGYLEEIAARYVAIRHGETSKIKGKRICVFVGDHRVVEESVSAYPQEVTFLMVKNFLRGGAAINVLARRAGADIEVIDVGMIEETAELTGLVRAKVKHGADNIAKGAAMSIEEAMSAILVGVERARIASEKGVSLIATGDMGIGNTTPSSAIYSAILRIPPELVVGPGTGLDTNGIARKITVVKRALDINKSHMNTPLEILASVGGLEIAGICGLCLGASARKMAVVVDGFISGAGALVATRLCPAVKDYLFFAHQSSEHGHKLFFQTENIRPILDLDLRLGEGTGSAIAMQIIEDAVAIYNEMATFEEVGIKPGA